MWRLKGLPSVTSSQLNTLPKCLPTQAKSTLLRLKDVCKCLREDTRNFWCGVRNGQAGIPAVKQVSDRHNCSFREGQELEGFTVEQVGHVPEYNLTAIRLQHKDTGASYLHIDRDDPNNVFSIHFRTTPMDSTGLPHILEHTVLCGSQRFPVRDPFFKMLNRSMATFMNAMTGPDYTFYPFATQNRQDFNNLMSIYLDAVFRPILSELDFKQEGWRLEHEEVSNPNTPIIFKGVVFNEMKGVFAENTSIFFERLLNSMLPNHTYGVCSGGLPDVIPKLTHNDLVTFHRNYYQPANARFYSYGTFPLEDHLKYISSTYLEKNQPGKVIDSSVPSQPRWNSERREHYSYRPDPMAADPQKQSSLAVSMLTSDITNIQEMFELEIIAELLVKGPNSSFYQTLVEPNIGAGLHPVTGFTSWTRDTFFTVGLHGMNSADFDKVIQIIDKTLEDVVEKGFDKKRVEEVLHGIELGMKHQSSDFGLKLLYGLTPLWNHNADLLLALRQAEHIAKLRKNIEENPHYLQEKVKQYLVGNPHRLVLTMSPDEDYVEKQSKTESLLLAEKVNKLTQDQKELVYKQGLILKEEQQKEEDISKLPTIHVADIKDEVQRYDLKSYKIGRIPVQFSAQPTNGVSYFRGVLNTSHLSQEHKQIFSLFCSVAAKMGTKEHDFRAFDHLVEMKTGGLGIGVHCVNNSLELGKFEEGLLFSSYCLDRNFNAMLDLWLKVFNSVTLEDLNRFETLVKNMAGNLVSGIIYSGHQYAMMSAGSQVSPVAQYQESSAGLTHVDLMKKLAGTGDLSSTLSKIQEIAKQVFNKDNIRVAVNAIPGSEKDVESKLTSFLEALPGTPASNPKVWSKAEVQSVNNQPGIHHVLPIPVNFAAKSIPTVPYTHTEYSSLRVLAKLLSSKYLHPNVREKGGAYGSGADVSMSGLFNFYSYRDPNSTATFDTFDGSYKWIADNKFTDQDIEEAKISIFKSLDMPVSPGSRGNLNFVDHVTYDMLQTSRQRVKKVSRDDILKAANTYLGPQNTSKSARALIGPENKDLLARSGETWKAVSHD